MIPKVTPLQNDFYSKFVNGSKKGGMIMLVQTPLVTAFNRVSVVSCNMNLSTVESSKRIYSGSADFKCNSTILHFMRGVSGHLVKETLRLGAKSFGLITKVDLDEYFKESTYGKYKSDLVFSGGLALWEGVINPADTLRTMWQAGQKISIIQRRKLFFHLYKGAGANTIRSFGIWFMYNGSWRYWSKKVDDWTPFNSRDISGNFVKAVPQAIQIMTGAWIFERLKNELQYRPDLTEKKGFRYRQSFNYIKEHQGWKGFTRGFVAKTMGMYILVLGSNYLIELGRK